MRAAVAGAPVSFGVFELTPEGAETVSPLDLLDLLRRNGYTGVDLGPVGYLGRGGRLRERLGEYGLALCGGWVQLPFTDDDAFAAALPALDEALAVFGDARVAGAPLAPRPTLADAGTPARRAAPGRGAEVDPLDERRWAALVRNLDAAVRRIRDAGFEPTFHHHAGTSIESEAEIDELLRRTEVGLTLDTGHLAIAGGDPLAVLARWGARVDHLHLKDVDLDVLHRVLHAGGGMEQVWSSGAFVRFGAGDLDVAAVMDAAAAADYSGWVVVEQDVLPAPGTPLDAFLADRDADQRANRDALRRWIP